MNNRLEKLLEIFKASEEDPFVIYALAKEYETIGKLEKALDFYKRLLSDHPDYVGTYYHLGGLYEKKGDEQKALGIYKQGLEVAQKLGDDHAYRELFAALSSLNTG